MRNLNSMSKNVWDLTEILRKLSRSCLHPIPNRPQACPHTVPSICPVMVTDCSHSAEPSGLFWVIVLFHLPAAVDAVDHTLLFETLHLLDSRTPLSLFFSSPHWLLLLCMCPQFLLVSLTSKIEVLWTPSMTFSVFMLTLLVILSRLQGFKPFLG